MNHQDVLNELKKISDKERAGNLQRFFKTWPGQYGEGDIFIGLTVPQQRNVAKKFKDIDLVEVEKLLDSKIHEHRFTALEILNFKYEKANEKEKKEIFDLSLKNIRFINNWDLVDTFAPYVFGKYLIDKKRDILYKLARSNNLWEKRISIVSCFAFIKDNDFDDAIKISEILLNDKHDLIHKAVGWVLREVGKKNLKVEEDFLLKYHKKMPRTMLRYSIEKFSQEKRNFYMAK